jgi:hypothetical protein
MASVKLVGYSGRLKNDAIFVGCFKSNELAGLQRYNPTNKQKFGKLLKQESKSVSTIFSKFTNFGNCTQRTT